MLERLHRPEWIDGGGHRGEGFDTYVSPAHGGPCALSYDSRRAYQGRAA